MNDQEVAKCKHCGADMKKWQPPADSTWSTPFLWVCFNDECSYFKRGWDHMMKTQEVKASYRHNLNPETGATGPLPCWSYDAQKDRIIED
ncbi:MAG: ogr/Delta-like zinc finger family protein [Proteobacteria bacterium]|nr:ogr/Delta-like zinc finger family protein [Pseudomonadota bacterium]MBU0989763.1 ogr/Delta-like zinc finger family protein [Pseudomonadota bacterium]